MSRNARWRALVAVGVLVCVLALRLTHVLTTKEAVTVGVLSELLDWAVLVGGTREAVSLYRKQRSAGLDGVAAFQAAYASQAGNTAARIAATLLRLLWPFWAWILRRPPHEPADQQHGYFQAVRTSFLLSISASMGLLLATQVYFLAVFHGWAAWLPALVGRAIPLWLLIFRAGWMRSPHLVNHHQLVLRRGPLFQAAVERDDVARVVLNQRTVWRGGWHRLSDDEIELPVAGQTNLTLQLVDGCSIRQRNGALTATRIHIYADDPDALLMALGHDARNEQPRQQVGA